MLKTIRVPIYGYKLHFAIGEDSSKVLTYLNRRLKKSNKSLNDHEIGQIKAGASPVTHHGFFLPLEASGNGILWLSSGIDLTNPKTFISLSHEVNHLCLEVFEFIGSEVNLQTQEPFCYLHDDMMEKCLEELKKYGNNNTSKEPVGVV